MRFIIAQVIGEWWGPLTQIGVVGALIYWLTKFIDTTMKSMELRLRDLEESNQQILDGFRDIVKSLETSVDRMAKAGLLQIISFEKHETTIKQQAQGMLREIESKTN